MMTEEKTKLLTRLHDDNRASGVAVSRTLLPPSQHAGPAYRRCGIWCDDLGHLRNRQAVPRRADVLLCARERLRLASEMRKALKQGEFRVYYQPIISLETDRISEVEALVRWEHPQRGLLSPDEFIPLAEETGLILPLGQWVLEESCRQVSLWRERHPTAPPLVLSVNLSARQLERPDLIADIAQTLRENTLKPDTLRLEITESVAIEDMESAAAMLQALRGLGVQLAIDDFGTGYSSLSYLKHLPVDAVKIDRSFVQGLGLDPE